jgi:hypothetical protein
MTPLARRVWCRAALPAALNTSFVTTPIVSQALFGTVAPIRVIKMDFWMQSGAQYNDIYMIEKGTGNSARVLYYNGVANTLTVHAFYKARLVRAYMGASNDERRTARDAEITEAVPGDDVPLVALQNTSHGAPYHLVNTTLNLVGARDLATVQRVSDYFVMSKRFCGSFRTGYRPTSEYSCATRTLGTAVAVSGAAATPNMGAQTPSAALSMLLTHFNVRLGVWAPTPNRGSWRAGSSRLWPVYTIQELLSQTTDLQPFVYLTDGGHFDNTGAYSLIQRGCRFILIGDCGADPDE